MDEAPDKKLDEDIEAEKAVGSIVKLVLICLAYGLLVYGAWNYDGPSGQTTSLGSFLMFLFPEVLIFVFLGLVIIVGAVALLIRFIRNLFSSP